jgi:uroporphyrin-III C-methyltransferase
LDSNIYPQLTLVGAGPGDPELITLKAIKALAAADVVLYDALVHHDLLEHASPKALKIAVGKRCGKISPKQEEINQLIVDNALKYGHVVRLKGGDPFVFGRGYEELQYAESFGIKVNIVPGITSAISVPGMNRIPVTTRGVNQSFWVATGTTIDGTFTKDLHLAIQSSATVVILMGMHNLPKMIDLIKQIGKHNLPVAIIQNGTLENQKKVIGTVSTIEELVQLHGIGTPALIVIGEVAGL